MLIAENRWRAMRYSFDDKLLDMAKGELVAFGELLEELLASSREDAVALDCLAEAEHARVILKRGTSAHQQIDRVPAGRRQGATDSEALVRRGRLARQNHLHGVDSHHHLPRSGDEPW